MAEPETVSVKIPRDLAARLEGRIAATAFRSLDEFVAYALARLAEGDPKDGEALSPEDERRVKEHLRALGYLD